MDFPQRYYLYPAAAYVRGSLKGEGILFKEALDQLNEEQREELFLIGKKAGLKMHRFKRARELPRVAKVLGLLRGLPCKSLLDIGTGRGVFLWPFMDEFSRIPVHCLDVLPYRVRDLQTVSHGGVERLSAELGDIQAYEGETGSYEGVTFLETLEHIPDPQKALMNACRMASKAVIVSVPSKPDENPEHIHLFNEEVLKELFAKAGVFSVKTHFVLNHLVVLGMIK